MKKLTKTQKAKIKEILFKFVHVFCYIMTGAFLITLIVASCQSCNASRVSAEAYNEENNRVYELKGSYDSVYERYTFNLEDIQELNTAFGLSNEDLYFEADLGETTQYTYAVYGTAQYYNESDYDYYSFNKIRYTFKLLDDLDDSYLYWRLYQLDLYDINDGWVSYIKKSNDNCDRYIYNAYNIKAIYSTSNFGMVNGVKNLFNARDTYTFVFNKEFNYNAPVNNTLENLWFNTPILDYGYGSAFAGRYYDVGHFISNGQLFDRIEWAIERTTSSHQILLKAESDDGVFDILDVPTDYYVYTGLFYVNTETNYRIQVNTRDSETGYRASLPYRAYLLTTRWVTDEYRKVTFLTDFQNIIYAEDDPNNHNKLTLGVIIQSFNNNNQTSVTGVIGSSGDVDNVFSLVASAFTAWLPIFNITLLPGITLGVLLFIPLVAMLVFAIIRIIKK